MTSWRFAVLGYGRLYFDFFHARRVNELRWGLCSTNALIDDTPSNSKSRDFRLHSRRIDRFYLVFCSHLVNLAVQHYVDDPTALGKFPWLQLNLHVLVVVERIPHRGTVSLVKVQNEELLTVASDAVHPATHAERSRKMAAGRPAPDQVAKGKELLGPGGPAPGCAFHSACSDWAEPQKWPSAL
jgi:hypothetical protein